MLNKLRVQGFKSLADVEVEFPRLTVLYGPNSAGKSNLLDSIQALSRIGTQRTLFDALGRGMIRGYAFELFALPEIGENGLPSRATAAFSISADLTVPQSKNGREGRYRYSVDVEIAYRSGALANRGEYLSSLSKAGTPMHKLAIEHKDDRLYVRRQRGGGRPRIEPLGQNYAVLSDARLASPAFTSIDRTRSELSNWRTYYLDPRAAMRAESPPMDVPDIGVFGRYLAPFLYKLKEEHPKRFAAVRRTIRTMIPSISDIDVQLERQGTLGLLITQDGTKFTSRVVSEGTLRLLALCAVTVNPWAGSLLTFEEPENGVHPRRVELIAKMLTSLALIHRRQVIVTTHSPLFCTAILKEARSHKPNDIGLFNVRRRGPRTVVDRFDPEGNIFDDLKVLQALDVPEEDHWFESLVLQGHVDE